MATERQRLPLNALRAFEAAARRLSFSEAAVELRVTHAAISHHVKALEAQLGMTLFKRDRRSVRLTEAGETLYPAIRSSFDNIAEIIGSLRTDHRRGVLNVSLTPSFATKWLVPRLARFRARHPDIDVRLSPSLALVDFAREPCDLAIRCGAGVWPGLRVDILLAIDMEPVCSPSFLRGRRRLRSPADLRNVTLIHGDIGSESQIGNEWRQWLAAVDMHGIDASHGLSFHDPSLALQAAIDGLGVAIGYNVLIGDDLATGRLVTPFDRPMPHPRSYYVVCPEASVNRAKIVAFRDWVIAEAKADTARFAWRRPAA